MRDKCFDVMNVIRQQYKQVIQKKVILAIFEKIIPILIVIHEYKQWNCSFIKMFDPRLDQNPSDDKMSNF